MRIADLVSVHVDLLLVGLAIAGIALLGFLVYFNDRSNVTNRVFLIFSLITVVWGSSNFLEYTFSSADATLWALRLHLFISTWHAFAFFTFCYIFPQANFAPAKWYSRYLLPLVIFVSVLTLTPFVFSGIEHLAPAGQVTRATPALGILLFMVVAFGLLISGLTILTRRTLKSQGVERSQNLTLLIGMTLTAVLILFFNVVLPNVFSERTYIPLASLFILPLIAAIAYAVTRYHLFNTKVVLAEVFSFVLCVSTLIQVAFSSTPFELIFRSSAFLLVLFVAILFVRSVMKEIEQKELIQVQEKELEIANEQQVNLLHFISHEIKGYLTKGQNAFAGIVEGDYGAASPEIMKLSQGALNEMRKGVETVMGILEASNFKKGTVAYTKKPFDFKQAAINIADDLRIVAEHKGLQFEMNVAPTGTYRMIGDEDKIKKHVIRNLVDNAVKYTLKGSIKVTISDGDGRVHFSVRDSGVGITPDDMKRLFTEGGHGKESIKVNVDSTGYGLYIAKQVVDAHGGKIWAESEGEGKGSTFIAEFPAS